MTNPYNEKISKIIRSVGFLLFILAVGLFVFSFFIDNSLLNPEKYEFGVTVEPYYGSRLSNFQLYYDFTNYKGKIYFKMIRSNITEYIQYSLPSQLIITKINWTNGKHISNKDYIAYQEGVDYEKDNDISSYNPPKSTFTITNKNKQNKSHNTMLEIHFKGKLSPNAEFEFNNLVETISPPSGEEKGAFVKFYIGDKYSCFYDSCFENLKKEELIHKVVGNHILISTKKEESGWRNIGYCGFSINYNKETNDIKSIVRNLSLWFGALGFFPFIGSVLIWYHKNKRKKKSKKQKI